jgi:DNA-binding transcriptional LysR family regulator
VLIKNILRQLDLQDVMVFVSLYKYRSARKTSDVLGVSHSTVSYCLKRLRECFGDELFSPVQHSMTPTAKADAIIPYLQNVIDSINHCAKPEIEPLEDAQSQIIRFNAPEYFELLVLPAVMQTVTQAFRSVTLHVQRLGRDLPVEDLLAGHVDFSIGFGPAYHRFHPELKWEALLEDAFVCLVSERPRPASRLTLEQFCEARHIFPTPWESAANMIDSWLEKISSVRTVVVRANTYQACIYIMEKTNLMLALPRRLLPLLLIPEGITVYDPPLGFPTFTLDLIWAKDRKREASLGWIRDRLKRSAAALADAPVKTEHKV